MSGLTIAVGLFVDSSVPFWGQYIVALWTWLVFLWLYLTSGKELRRTFLLGVILVTILELFCSEVWKIYEYRGGSLLLYVPPGHALLYDLGLNLSQRLSRAIVWAIPALFAPFVFYGGFIGFDTEGAVWFLIFLICLARGRNRKMYATMFALAWFVELWGTHLGNWTWAMKVPYLPLTTTNPPLCAGLFYCIGDMILFALTHSLINKRHPFPNLLNLTRNAESRKIEAR